jgi:hypothetical protein
MSALLVYISHSDPYIVTSALLGYMSDSEWHRQEYLIEIHRRARRTRW